MRDTADRSDGEDEETDVSSYGITFLRKQDDTVN
jgi:hypothetical protein